MREKEFGIWNAFSWADYQARVKRIALGLRQLGVARGDVVALIGNNRPEWIWGEVAAHALGAMSLGIYQDSIGDEVSYLLAYAEAKIIIAEDEEQVDKLLDLIGHVPSARYIVYAEPRGMRKYSDPRLIGLEQLYREGEAADAPIPGSTSARSPPAGARTSPSFAPPRAPPRGRSWRCCRADPSSGTRSPICIGTRSGRSTTTSRCCRCHG